MMVMKDPDSCQQHNSKFKRIRHKQEQVISSYISFGYVTSICLGLFTIIYIVIFVYNSTAILEYRDHRAIGFQALPSSSRRNRKPNQGDATVLEQQSLGSIKKMFDTFRHGISDNHLIQQVENEIAVLRKNRQVGGNRTIVLDKSKNTIKDGQIKESKNTTITTRNGFVVLGMHRSGTSMLSGLMVTGLGYYVGEPLIGGAFDNEKGFFELLDVVLQNDEFMNMQNVWWSYNVMNYDYKKALTMAQSNLQQGGKYFKRGRKALKFLNDPLNVPWLQKDPRMCITLKSWLPLLSNEPAVLWTYRHPMEVAQSLVKREEKFTLDHALRLWIVYNMRALQNSADLCRVYTSNDDVIKDPMNEVLRVSKELTTKCGVPKPPTELTIEDVNKFVDPTLQHNQHDKFKKGAIIEKHGADCNVYELVTTTDKTSPIYETELKLYRIAMRFYCDMKSGIAYQDAYEWPDL